MAMMMRLGSPGLLRSFRVTPGFSPFFLFLSSRPGNKGGPNERHEPDEAEFWSAFN